MFSVLDEVLIEGIEVLVVVAGIEGVHVGEGAQWRLSAIDFSVSAQGSAVPVGVTPARSAICVGVSDYVRF